MKTYLVRLDNYVAVAASNEEEAKELALEAIASTTLEVIQDSDLVTSELCSHLDVPERFRHWLKPGAYHMYGNPDYDLRTQLGMHTPHPNQQPLALDAPKQDLRSKASGAMLATGYTRVVHGERGSYVEFSREQLLMGNFHVPNDVEWRRSDPNWVDRVYFIEHRSVCEANVMLYEQRKPVIYADYKVGMFYIAVGDIADGEALSRE